MCVTLPEFCDTCHMVIIEKGKANKNVNALVDCEKYCRDWVLSCSNVYFFFQTNGNWPEFISSNITTW